MLSRHCKTSQHHFVKGIHSSFIKVILCLMLASLLLMSLPGMAGAATGDATTTGSMALVPTFENVGAVVNYSGDNNKNCSTVLEYRTSGGTWKPAPQMYADRGGHQFRGSIFWLTTNTDYEVRVTFSDADGVSGTNPVTATVKTRNDNPPSSGRSLYVATTGSDSAAGTESAPYKTIGKAASVVAAGDTVYVKAGTYSAGAKVTVSGTVNNYITFRNYGSDTPVISGGGNAFYIEASYIRIKGFKMQSQTGSAVLVSGEHTPTTGVIVEDCIMIDPDMSGTGTQGGVRIDYGAENVLVQRNTMTFDSGPAVEDRTGVTWWRPGGGHVFRNNNISGSNGKLWDGFGGGPEDLDTTSNNVDIYNNTVIGAQDDGAQPEGGDVNVRVYNNRFYNSFQGVAMAPVLKGPIYVFRNIIPPAITREIGAGGAFKMGNNTLGRIYLYHNTVYAASEGADGPFATNSGLQNILARNNIIHASWYIIEFGHGSGDIYNHDFNYDNLYSTTSTGRFIKWGDDNQVTFSKFQSSYGQEKNGMSISAANEFVNISGRDFALKSGSAFIDKGAILPGFNDANSPWPYSGTAPDLGALESGPGPPTNNPPLAVNDSYSATRDTTLAVSAPGVLGNDSDADSTTLTVSKVSDPAHGSLTLNSNGSFNYIPAAGYTGSDSFAYKVNDGTADSNTATVTVTVARVNNAPAVTNRSFSASEDSVLNTSAPGVLNGSSDADGDTLTAVKVTNPAHGSVTLNANGSFTYTPAANYSGTDSFTFKANDGLADSNTATATITVAAVNDKPLAVNESYTVNSVLSVATPGVLANDTDSEGNPLTSALVSGVGHGTLAFNANGSFTYTPATGYTGSDSFSYKANDGVSDSDPATVFLTVQGSADSAPVTSSDVYNVTNTITLNVNAPGVLANDSDANGDTLTAVLVTDVTHCSLTLNSNGSFTYVPDSDYVGTDTFTYKANDGDTFSSVTTVTLIVTAPAGTNPPAGATDTFGHNSGTDVYTDDANEIDTVRLLNDSGTGTLTKLEIMFDDASPSGKVRMGVYADNGGTPGNLLLDAGEASVANGWVAISGLALPVQQDTYYWLAFNIQSDNGIKCLYDVAGGSHYWVSSSYGSLPGQFPTAGADSNGHHYVLRATVAQTPPAGDSTPPVITGVSSSNIASNAADIKWATDELSTSQVEYAASPTQTTPQDNNMVTQHLVRLNSLNPGTTYTYKIISLDSAGNRSEAAGGTFTTPSATPVTPATFVVSDLVISPTQVSSRQTVNISVLVTNNGGTTGTYTVTLKVNGTKESSKTVTLAAGANVKVTFTTSKWKAGKYNVDVNGLTGTFEVKSSTFWWRR